jgi:NitT/TauT family transport system permease protein
MLDHLSISVFRTMAGVLVAVALALSLAIVVSAVAKLESYLKPLVALRYIPISAFVPLTILWAGIGERQKVFIIFLGSFLQALPLYVAPLRAVEQNFIDIGRVYGLSNWSIATRVRLRRALPAILDVTRVIFGIGWSCLLTAEIVASTQGLGFLIAQSQREMAVNLVFAAMVWVGVVGLTCDVALLRVKKQVFRWDQKLFEGAAEE